MHHTTALIARQSALAAQGRPRGQRGRVSAALLRRAGLGLAAVALIALLAWALKSWVGAGEAKPRPQVARIAILPDTPPP
ncbi:hypothetical protein, partial [Ideonella livida]|nr:hypothetical protein [Ideonella livida]